MIFSVWDSFLFLSKCLTRFPGIVGQGSDNLDQMFPAAMPCQIIVKSFQNLIAEDVGIAQQFKEGFCMRCVIFSHIPRMLAFIQVIFRVTLIFRIDETGF